MSKWPIGVFVSIDAGLGVNPDVAHELGVPTVHLHTPHPESRTPERAKEFLARLDKLGIQVTVVFAGFEGESYADIPTVERTIGLVPAATRAARTAELKEIADFANLMGVKTVGLHIGFVPHDRSISEYRDVLAVTRDVCDYVKKNGQAIHLETGQEPAGVLLAFLEDVERDNLFINFDPANMILYGCGEPIPALKTLGQYVRSIHCKDATWSDQPGKTWGAEVALGQGDVNFAAYLRTLNEIGYTGPLTIEREIPQEPVRQKAEIAAAIETLQSLKRELA
ncbi:sugar phosphate isomerase/epimerase family protein [Lacipirellula limnantheis]|uniref:Xylose isomerase-like TIM barrel n=1 Tax=Lacipirellula limnantheis TaxID=2528024 RepID=A0A517TVN3_9BACT|nr:sugar phosphate isomerase/epimerase family protein [Lacipirellula limnantheis]QDT72433.1 Xylose isomerase-like TIM barrel [Lacipirellula limnantheis]